MAASVRIEDEAFGDRRYDRLALEAGLADADHARGKMAVLWRQCTLEQRHILPVEDVNAVLGSRGAEALILARLGETHRHGIRIRGTKGRIEWLRKLRENGAKGGRPKKKPEGLASGSPELNPPAPAPVLNTPLPPKGAGKQLPSIPESLDSPAFREAWTDWLQHRRERKPAVTPTAAKRAFAEMAAWGPDRAVAAIAHSIARSYQGIFEPTANGKPSPASAVADEEARAKRAREERERKEAKRASEVAADPWKPEPTPDDLKF